MGKLWSDSGYDVANGKESASHGSMLMSYKDIAVMVPEDFLDEAHVVIESQDAYDDFSNFALENEDYDDFGSGSFYEDEDF